MEERSHPECDPELELEGELALTRALVISGEYFHAAEHLASALALDPTAAAVGDVIAQLARELGPLASDAVTAGPDGGTWSGAAALKASLLRATAKRDEAVSLLAAVIGADPHRPWPALLSAWLQEDPGLPLPPEALAGACAQLVRPLLGTEPDDAVATTLSSFTDVLTVAVERYPGDARLRLSASGVARRCDQLDRALDWANRRMRSALRR